MCFLSKKTLEKSEGTIKRHWQHWVHKTQDEGKNNKTQTTKKMSNTDPQTTGGGGEPMSCLL
jgi:hypothetical protein